MDRVRNWVLGLGLAVLVAVFLFPDIFALLWPAPPVEDGNILVFSVDEETGPESHRYDVKLRFRRKSPELFRLQVLSPHGNRTLDVTEDLEPTANPDNDPFEFPIIADDVSILPGLVWLPPDRRKGGMNCLSGLVVGLQTRDRWQVWQVMHADGEVFFERETGLLAGFEMRVGRTRVQARLRALH